MEGTLSAPEVLGAVSASLPRAERRRLTVVCAALTDRLDVVPRASAATRPG